MRLSTIYTTIMTTAAVLALTPAEAAEPTHCALAAKAAPDSACVDNPYGAVLGETPQEAARLAAALAAGEVRFQRHFGRTPPPYVLGQGLKPAQLPTLKNVGFGAVFPWLTSAQFEESSLASVRRGTEEKLKAAGLGPDKIQEAVEKAQQAWRTSNPPTKRHSTDNGAVAHELGHAWYSELYWPSKKLDDDGKYGGPGPDWMDETAAVLMEDETLTISRRDQFAQVYRGTAPKHLPIGGVSAAELVDLNKFLHRDHPMAAVQRDIVKKAAKGGMGIATLTGEEAKKVSQGGILFYVQSRAFADLVIDRSGSPAIFADIGAAFGRGETIEQWLATNGAKNRLGSNVAELEKIWRDWLRARFGEPAAA